MENEKNGLVSILFNDKSNIIKFILCAVLLTIGLSIFANFIFDKLKHFPDIILALSFSPIICVLGYIIYLFYKKSKRIINIEAVAVIDRKTKKIIPIPRYDFGSDLAQNLLSVFLENEAFKSFWHEEILPKENNTKNEEKEEVGDKQQETTPKNETNEVTYFEIRKMNYKEYKYTTNNAEELLNEAIEYTLLEKLSLTLSTYFNDFSEEDKYIKTYAREDISKYLLKNRVLNLLSTPFSDRPIFKKLKKNNGHVDGEIVAIWGSDGSRYNKFDLILPKNSAIKRPEQGVLEISNNCIELQIKVENKGFTANLPSHFEEDYLGYKNMHDLIARKIYVTMSYKVKFFTLFSARKKVYHEWVDYFSKELVDYCSFDVFLEKIHWEECLTNINVLNNRLHLAKTISKM